jgi:hypothetical protein
MIRKCLNFLLWAKAPSYFVNYLDDKCERYRGKMKAIIRETLQLQVSTVGFTK